MSVYPLWVVICSVDGQPIDFDEYGYTMGEARANARANGWKTGRGRQGPDYCPEHRAAIFDGRKAPISETGGDRG